MVFCCFYQKCLEAKDMKDQMPVKIIMDIRAMRGKSRARLMKADDGNYYVVKFLNNPQGTTVLVNDWLASSMAIGIGLDVAKPQIVEVEDYVLESLVKSHPYNAFLYSNPGPHFASKFAENPSRAAVFDYLPESMVNGKHLANTHLLIGALIFDLWLCNVESRQF